MFCTRFSHVFWIDASSPDTISMSLKGISSIPAAQASGVNDSVESVLQWISHIQGEWLIVFDNADDPSPEVVANFIPPGNRGNIIITSRNQSMRRVIAFDDVIEIIEMEESDAIALLLRVSYLEALPKHIQAAKGIVGKLGCIPLAVSQAGAYIEAGKCDINEYLRWFNIHHQTLMSDVAFKGVSGYKQTVYGTWDLSLKEIEKRGKSTTGNAQVAQAAILILQICAFYHHSNISKEIFQSAAEASGKHAADRKVAKKLLGKRMALLDHLLALDKDGHWNSMIFEEGISMLLSFSLMRREQSPGILSIHPLMHSWSREKMSESEQKRICQIGGIILFYAIPIRYESEDCALRRLMHAHVMEYMSYAWQIGLMHQYYDDDDRCEKFALVMMENGDWKNAEQLGVQVVNIRKKVLGAKHPNTLRAMGNLAATYLNQGRWNEAEQVNVQVMDMSKKVLGAEHPNRLVTMGNLATTYLHQRRWNEAEQLEIQVMDMMKKVLGAEHPDTVTSMRSLANTYLNQGRWNEAEQLNVQVMGMMKKVLGAEHPDTLINIGNLAITYTKQGRWNEAEQLQVQVMDIRKKVLGRKHPDTLTSMRHLAYTYRNQGRQKEAEQLLVQVEDMRQN